MKKRLVSAICAFVIALTGGLTVSAEVFAQPPGDLTPQAELLLQPTPFLTMPFEKKCDSLKITEGWFYSPHERQIHGVDVHYGVDFACPRETPVVAMADGYAIRSYHSFVLPDQTHEGKTVGYGLGEFVQIWHPEQQVYTVYAHLGKAAHEIAFVETQKSPEGNWNPIGIYRPTEEIMKVATPVKRGQQIGLAGDSGLQWGYTEDLVDTHVMRPDPATHPSWDEVHAHIEVYNRLPDGSLKDKRFDPFDIYGQVRDEFNPYRKMRQGPKGMWITKWNGKPCYADKLGNQSCPQPVEAE